ncbi:MAG: aminotransferase class I/II-fold pyridoxal phosphate-dependent enzyme [Planctomycetota bacterium]|nr:MAG: aminotransferase class I/II-fold pyridoxal phosphate-dependent enzyme [Planctomycetota bacterium]
MTAPPLDTSTATTATLRGREVIVFGGCNYLGLAQHPSVLAAATAALNNYGLSASASRETTGNTSAHQDLERALTEFCGFESGLLVPDGYIANLAALQALAASGCSAAVLDERAHPSLADAARMAGLELHRFRHLDTGHAAQCLERLKPRAVVITDSVFAADGAIAPSTDLHAMLRPEDVLLLDDCHGFCVLGNQGRGTADAFALSRDRLVVTTTLAKGLGCAGGVVLGTQSLIETCRRNSTAYICTTPASPILTVAAIEAVRVMQRHAELHESLCANSNRVAALLRSIGDHTQDPRTPIFAFTLGLSAETLREIHQRAWDQGVWLPLVEYPGGPAPVYFRLSVSAAHTPDQIDKLTAVLGSVQSPTCPLPSGAKP